DPDYGYVRNGTGADAYYGEETVVEPAYSPGYRYYDYGPACCYSSLSVGTVWYDGYDGRRDYRRRGDWHGPPPPRGDWHDRRDSDRRPGNWRGDNRPDNRPGGWRGDNRPDRGDHRPGNWQGQGGGNRPSGGWHGGGNSGGDHRPAPSATPRSA